MKGMVNAVPFYFRGRSDWLEGLGYKKEYILYNITK